ncbi:hypothetical protein SAE01_43600 [Segetibacter aerophilus]|uniref:Uncharacterized protein n=1 Tax=Segetibacter aerophilus TaxID=670293 RepID=A0A512BIS4_9BACT|nr:hypothetical protein SAE01_43600 [Segetibacter aerophilus]
MGSDGGTTIFCVGTRIIEQLSENSNIDSPDVYCPPIGAKIFKKISPFDRLLKVTI